MDRRNFLAAAGAGGVALVPGVASAQALPEVRWRMVSSFPKSLETLYGCGPMISKRVAEMTSGKFQIQVFAAGEIVGPLQVLDAVQNATVECGYTSSAFYSGKDPSFMFDASVPFGPNVRQQNAWMLAGGGREAMQDLFSQYNIYAIPAGNTGGQMGGWFRKEIKSIADLKGLKFRVAGIAGRILATLGAVPQQIGGGDVYPALERGTLDAAEYSGPFDDEKLGFVRVAKYYYLPGWWEGQSMQSLYINQNLWKDLPEAYKAALEAACAEANVWSVAKCDAENPDALRRLIAAGAEVKVFPNDVMKACYTEAFRLYGEIAETNPRFKKIYENWNAFRTKETFWFRLNEFNYEYFLYSQT